MGGHDPIGEAFKDFQKKLKYLSNKGIILALCSKNDENTLIISNANDSQAYQSFFNSLWSSIDEKWLLTDPAAESKNSYPSCSDNIDNDFDNKIDLNDLGCIN